MKRNSKLVKAMAHFYQRLCNSSPSTIKEQSLWLLRAFLITRRQPDWVNAGFVLPTVAMVALVVVLLTTAIMFRSFDRSKNAANVRVNQAVLNAAMPAIDRAKAKIEQLFTDPTLPRSTPSDTSLYNAFSKNLTKYTFGDESPLVIKYDLDDKGGITETGELEEQEAVRTVWRFPVDTDNNGKFDSYTLYGIFFRSPKRGNNGQFVRSRNPLDARTPPMDDGSLGGLCSAARGTSASLIGESGWYKSGASIKKSFFVYAATVPISSNQIQSEGLTTNKYEPYSGNKGFSAVEFQQDQERTPISNNAVVYEDDLEITPGSGLRLNGRIFTNSNLLTAKTDDPIVRFYQVSSPLSCFYQAQNSKIIVGGNVGLGRISGTTRQEAVDVDLFKPGGQGPTRQIDANNKSANNTSAQIAFNTQAYAQRINLLVEAQTGNNATDYSKDPTEVQENIKARIKENPGLDVADVRRKELEAYFKKRTRKVPFVEVGLGVNPGTASLQDIGTDKVRSQDRWIYPVEGSTDNTGLTLNVNKLPATEPNKLKDVNKEEEKFLGDRILVGNNLPALWFDKAVKDFVGSKIHQQIKPDTEWDDWDDEKYKYRTRNTKIEQLISLEGATERDGLIEQKAVEKPKTPLDNVGGMRVVTGAGIYVDGASGDPDAFFPWNTDMDSSPGPQPRSFFTTRPTWDLRLVDPTNGDANRIKVNSLNFNSKPPIIVYPDSMPMTGDATIAANPNVKGDLLMRATAVYFYKKPSNEDNSGKDQMPIACISSYYDPTNATTAQNRIGLPAAATNPDALLATASSKSNNGVVYPPYAGTRASAISTHKRQLDQQARLVFPDGRFVNEPLRNALERYNAGQSLSMADNSAVDTAVCAIQILNGTLLPNASPPIDHRTIYETAFLDARQIKAIEREANVYRPGINPNDYRSYNRSLEERQPLEVRVTVLDLDKLRKKKIGGVSPQEYLLPNSGIIYATRDDALPDLSDSPNNKIDTRKLLSPTDYKLDPTRRPNGIMLINGINLEREAQYRDEEKGLILATNVPAYVEGHFNLHSKGGNPGLPVEEFVEQLRNNKGEIDWSKFYERKTLDDNFACRKGDPRLPSNKCQQGDSWRPATVIADAVTILSDNFRFGFRNEGDYDLRINGEGVSVVPNYDIDGNGIATDTITESSLLIDLNNDGTTDANEILRADLNGDGDVNDSVKEADQISAANVRRRQGFFDNNYLTSSSWFDTSSNAGYPRDFDGNAANGTQGSSYVNNFVTPIQRRVIFGEYVMEICRKVPVSTCLPNDWVVFGNQKASQIPVGTPESTLDSGTTARLASNTNDQRYPRRVAFLRDSNNRLILDSNGYPVPIGVDASGNINYYPYNSLTIPVTGDIFTAGATTSRTFQPFSRTNSSLRPRLRANALALWFRTADDTSFTNGRTTGTNYGKANPLFYLYSIPKTPVSGQYQLGTNEQPLLVPVLQIHMPFDEWTRSGNDPGDSRPDLPGVMNRGLARDRNWLQRAVQTTTNLLIVGGDTPGRPTETNGGLENFVRYLEQWRENNVDVNSSISGSIIQYKRSAYATAPWLTIQLDASNQPLGQSIFGADYPQFYKTNATPIPGATDGRGMSPFYTAPARQWGFDVALLSQIPDLFAQQFTFPPARKPNEFFREVGRDDDWVKTLLCAKTVNDKDAVFGELRPKSYCEKTGS